MSPLTRLQYTVRATCTEKKKTIFYRFTADFAEKHQAGTKREDSANTDRSVYKVRAFVRVLNTCIDGLDVRGSKNEGIITGLSKFSKSLTEFSINSNLEKNYFKGYYGY